MNRATNIKASFCDLQKSNPSFFLNIDYWRTQLLNVVSIDELVKEKKIWATAVSIAIDIIDNVKVEPSLIAKRNAILLSVFTSTTKEDKSIATKVSGIFAYAIEYSEANKLNNIDGIIDFIENIKDVLIEGLKVNKNFEFITPVLWASKVCGQANVSRAKDYTKDEATMFFYNNAEGVRVAEAARDVVSSIELGIEETILFLTPLKRFIQEHAKRVKDKIEMMDIVGNKTHHSNIGHSTMELLYPVIYRREDYPDIERYRELKKESIQMVIDNAKRNIKKD